MADVRQSDATLVVASAGGHLMQARLLAPRLGLGSVTWVTYPVQQAESMLAGEDVVYAHHPTTKNVGNAARNYRLARRVFRDGSFQRIVSTGAAVAVPFMLRARQLGIACHYLESATRVTGPSLSGRMLQAVPGVRLYRQVGTWGGRRWRAGPCVFDGYDVASTERSAGFQPLRAVVSLGTQAFPFDALVEAIRQRCAPALEQITWQLASTPEPPGLAGHVVDQLPVQDLQDEIKHADVLVGHCGVGLALTALALGKVPVLVPRRRRRGEHTDDHQVDLAGELDRRGLAVVVEAGELSYEHLERAASLVATWREPPLFELDD